MIESLFDIKYLMTDVFLGTYFGCFMRVFPTSSPTSQGTFQNAKHRWGWGLTNGRVVGRSHGPVNLKPRQGIVRSSNINPTKKNKTSLHIPQKIDIFCWVEIYSSCFYVHHQFLGGLPTKTQLEATRQKTSVGPSDRNLKKVHGASPTASTKFQTSTVHHGWEKGIRQVVVSCVGNGGRARNMLGDDF